ncbi:MAG: extracellular solute-binding protein [Patescibacteria group bacterium]
MNTFQTIVLGIFGFFILAGLAVLATTKGRGGESQTTLVLWGAANASVIRELEESAFPRNLRLAYREISPELLDTELVEALASRRGPDIVLLPLELLLRHQDKLLLIPYANYSERQFKDTFIQAGDLFLTKEGIAALPFSLDPLLMFVNRDSFDEAGIASPPRFWDEFLLLAGRLTRREESGAIARSAVSLGEYRNISHAKELLAALFLQSGNALVSRDEAGAARAALSGSAAQSVLDFYTEFANPTKPLYAWNRSLPLSRAAFLSSRLAVYFGFGSELQELRKTNPNLNFDAASLPRPRGAEVGVTYGKLTGVALLGSTAHPSAALQAAHLLTGAEAAALVAKRLGLPPARRELLQAKPTDAFGGILFDSALRARGFLDPHPRRSDELLQTMVESVTSGKRRSSDALSRAESELRALLR